MRLRTAVALVALLALSACSAGQSPVETCVAHSVEEGVDEAAARTACEDAVGEQE